MKRLSWDQYFMAQSHLLANRSTCPRLAVGATIVRDKRIIAGGYNGSISGGIHCIDEGCYMIDGHCVRTIHAEMNAILQCAKFGVPTQGAEIYVTHFPCLQCCKAIIQSGIKTVYYAADYKNHPYAIELFESAKVKTIKVPFDNFFEQNNQQEKLELFADVLKKLENAGVDEKEIRAFYEKAQSIFSNGV
ncbi:dCMP deaminase [Scopulibacillus daqui]|uniref:ComE operon protein 2 n=1 Tax=Scopulibacillus daqui TaxID=1469162 RepID=A0ABS2Q0T0_9BACL|nr:ComE operon protein 2 [Scopulibacillus daqui]MBM7645821.1 dCMP deaminase [Scopulibacillus daqui]